MMLPKVCAHMHMYGRLEPVSDHHTQVTLDFTYNTTIQLYIYIPSPYVLYVYIYMYIYMCVYAHAPHTIPPSAARAERRSLHGSGQAERHYTSITSSIR